MDNKRTCIWEYEDGHICGKELDRTHYFFCEKHFVLVNRRTSCSFSTADTGVIKTRTSPHTPSI